LAIQDRWDRVRLAIQARAIDDYDTMMSTGIVCRRARWVGGKDGREVTEYEIDSGAIEALNAIEKRGGDRDGPGST
jgi:hypothetical protein